MDPSRPKSQAPPGDASSAKCSFIHHQSKALELNDVGAFQLENHETTAAFHTFQSAASALKMATQALQTLPAPLPSSDESFACIGAPYPSSARKAETHHQLTGTENNSNNQLYTHYTMPMRMNLSTSHSFAAAADEDFYDQRCRCGIISAMILYNTALTFYIHGQVTETLDLYRMALLQMPKRFMDTSPLILQAIMNNLGTMQHDCGEYEMARLSFGMLAKLTEDGNNHNKEVESSRSSAGRVFSQNIWLSLCSQAPAA